jgi:hypothetical protein
VVGSPERCSSLIVADKIQKLKFKFVDLLGFLAGGSLAENAKAFRPDAGRQKAYFPYDLLTCDNGIEELSRLKAFAESNFDDSLQGKKVTDEEYAEYLKETEGKARLEFLLYCNERDTEIMIPIADTLIGLFWNNSTPEY